MTEFPSRTFFTWCDLDHWLDDKTVVVIIEGNLYSPQASSMISFVFTIDKNEYGVVDKQIFIEVSDYVLTTTTTNVYTENHNNTSEVTDGTDSQLDITHYLFALLLCFIVSNSNQYSKICFVLLVYNQTVRRRKIHSKFWVVWISFLSSYSIEYHRWYSITPLLLLFSLDLFRL